MRKNDAATTKLLAILNVFDLLVSVSTFLVFVTHSLQDVVLFEVFAIVFRISVYITGYVTCLLAMVRVIHLVLPLHGINWRAIKVSVAVYCSIVVLLQVFYLYEVIRSSDSVQLKCDNILNANVSNVTTGFNDTTGPTFPILCKLVFNVGFLIIVILFVIIISANVTSLVKLHLAQKFHRDTWKRKATVTVAMISAVYCVCNIVYVTVVGAETYSLIHYFSMYDLVKISHYILLPLNSAFNPVIYLLRREDMRSYVKTLWSRSAESWGGERGQNHEGFTPPTSEAAHELRFSWRVTA